MKLYHHLISAVTIAVITFTYVYSSNIGIVRDDMDAYGRCSEYRRRFDDSGFCKVVKTYPTHESVYHKLVQCDDNKQRSYQCAMIGNVVFHDVYRTQEDLDDVRGIQATSMSVVSLFAYVVLAMIWTDNVRF